MHSRKGLAAPKPVRMALPLIKPLKPNPFLCNKSPKVDEGCSREEEEVAKELNTIFTLPFLKRKPSPDMFSHQLKKTPSPGMKRTPSRPQYNPLTKDKFFQRLDSISETSTCDPSQDAIRPVL